jgi:hypothetical protein
MRNLLLPAAIILLFGTLFSQPIRFFITTNEAGFPIEHLTYVPNSYRPASDEKYFELKNDVPGHNYIDTKFQSTDTYFRFIQTENSEAMSRYLDTLELGSFYSKEVLDLSGGAMNVTYYRDGTRRFGWVKGDKRYNIITDDTYLRIDELERMGKGLEIYKIDPLLPIKKTTDSFFALMAGFIK